MDQEPLLSKILFRIKFTAKGEFGDFDAMIKDQRYSDCLFIFNDDIDHMSDTTAGWGTAVIRPYRGTRAEGYPTGYGYGRNNGFKDLKDYRIIQWFNEANRRILETMKRQKLKYAFLSCGDDWHIGNNTFKNIPLEVKERIAVEFSRIFDEIVNIENEQDFNEKIEYYDDINYV